MDRPKDWDKFGVYNEVRISWLRSLTPAEKIRLVEELNRTGKQRAAARLRRENPTWTESEVQAEVTAKWMSGVEDYFIES